MSKHLSMSQLVAKVAFLKFPPEAWDALIPHGIRWKQQFTDYAAAGVVRDLARHVGDRALQEKLLGVGREMAAAASGGLVKAYDEGGDLCPPYRPFPWHGPLGGGGGDGGDGPPIRFEVGAVNQIVVADLLLSLAGVTAHAGFGGQLKTIAVSLAEGAAKNLARDFDSAKLTPG